MMSLEIPRVGLDVGIFFVVLSVITGAIVIAGAKDAQSPVLFVCLFGGLFSGVPGALGIGAIVNHRRMPRNSN